MQRDKNLGLNLVTARPGRSAPAYSVYWRLLQTGRRSDPELESVLTLLFINSDTVCHKKFLTTNSSVDMPLLGM